MHAVFRGKVQGVGFRWTVLDYAENFLLKGTVRNLKDGTVEVYAQGSQETLEAFLQAIQKDSGAARIQSIKTDFQALNETSFDGFRII